MNRPPRGPGSWQTPWRADGPDNRPDNYGRPSGPAGLYDAGFRGNIPLLYDLWSKEDLHGTVELWRTILMNYSKKNTGIVFDAVSDILQGKENLQEFTLFLRRNLPLHLQSSCITQQQHTQHLCALLESLHSRISALEARLK